MMKRTWLFFFFTVLAFLTACGGGADSVEPNNGADTAQEIPFTLDQLVATDPGTVQLAAGKVQLIEFFAYW
jgi:hypothetical protein